MSQHDMVVDNASGATVRGDINDALQALASMSSGTSEPSTKYAYQPWADTTNSLLKQRNAANTGWIIRGTLAESSVTAKSSAYTVAIGDYAKTFNCSGTFTLSFTAAATLGDGFHFGVRNNGTGTVTLDPNSSETVDGATTVKLAPGESCIVWCDGSGFITIGRVAIDGLTEDTSPDLDADFADVYDMSAGVRKKVKLGRIGAGVLGTPVATTSGTTAAFTGIPSWATKITISVAGLSSSGTSNYILQLGDSGGYETTGYNGSTCSLSGTAVDGTAPWSSNNGIVIANNLVASAQFHGAIFLTRENSSTNTWSVLVSVSRSDAGSVRIGAGSKATSAALDRVQLTTSNGTDTFDGGEINIHYE